VGERIFIDVFLDQVVLTDEVRATLLLKHPEVADFIDRIGTALLLKHPEVADFIDRIGTALKDPDEVRQSTRDTRKILYYRFEAEVLGGKWIVVVVKRIDRSFVATIYATHRIKTGEVVWTKK
jgi:hypothetical protein